MLKKLKQIFRFSSWGLLFKFTVPIIAIVLVGAFVILFVMSGMTSSSLESQVRKSLVQEATLLSDTVGQMLRDRISTVETSVVSNFDIVSCANQASPWSQQKKYEEYKRSQDILNYARFAENDTFYKARKYLEGLSDKFGFLEIRLNGLDGIAFMATRKLVNAGSLYDSWFVKVNEAFAKGEKYYLEPPVYNDKLDAFVFGIAAPILNLNTNTPVAFLYVSCMSDTVFESAFRLSGTDFYEGTNKSYGWLGKNEIILSSSQKHTVGDKVGSNPSFSKRHAQYLSATFDTKGNLVDSNFEIVEKLHSSDLTSLIKMYDQTHVKYLESEKDSPQRLNFFDKLQNLSFGFSSESDNVYSFCATGFNQNLKNLGHIFVSMKVSEYDKPVTILQTVMVPSIVGIVLIIMFAIFLIIKYVSKPIFLLAGSIYEVSLGNYDVKVPVQTEDEIGEVASSFNTMIDDIRVELKYWKRRENL
jgi:HAMP domain-containing protein